MARPSFSPGKRRMGRVRNIMKMAVLQHVPFEGPAAVADWAAARKIGVTVRHLYRGDLLPDLSEFDMLTVMGGPMSANDERVLPWLAPEIARVGDAIASDKIVLGVCLGAQIIAKALGAKVYKGAQNRLVSGPRRSRARLVRGASGGVHGVSLARRDIRSAGKGGAACLDPWHGEPGFRGWKKRSRAAVPYGSHKGKRERTDGECGERDWRRSL